MKSKGFATLSGKAAFIANVVTGLLVGRKDRQVCSEKMAGNY